MVKTFQYRIKDSGCAAKLTALARACNQVWNFCNESQDHALRWNQRWPTYPDLCKLTTGSSKELGLHSQTVQAVCEQYATRRQQSKKRKLRWRGKRSPGWIPFKASGVKVTAGKVVDVSDTIKISDASPIETKIAEAERNTDLQTAAELKYGKLMELEKKLQSIQGKERGENQLLKEEIDGDDIAQIVSKWTGIPVNRLVESEITCVGATSIKWISSGDFRGKSPR